MKPRLAAAVLAIAWTLAASEDVLRDEDVVRMELRGDSDTRIIETIRAARTAFDLSDEMLAELRIAGISDAVLRAMRERQTELDGLAAGAVAESAVAVEAPPNARTVRLTGVGGVDKIPFPAEVPDSVAERMELGSAPDDRVVKRSAWFAMCTTATHVPDHWRSRSPLGRDFAAAPRHEILAFAPAEGPVLALPAVLEIALDPGQTHTLVVGAALEIAERWRIVSASVPFEVPADSGSAVASFEIAPPARGTDLTFRKLDGR